MQMCNCFLRLGGDLGNVVHMKDASVAEIYLLRVLHGEDSVTRIKPTRQEKRSARDEMDRLRRKYRRSIQSPEGPKHIVDQVFPGSNPNMPTTLEDIGVSRDNKYSRKRAQRKQAEQAESESESEDEDEVVIAADGTGPGSSE